MQLISASRIGAPGKAVFGVCHLNRPARHSTAVLLCSPLGVDGVGSHRTLVVLAEALAQSGRSALRFDYRCTGDSDGRCEEARLEDWLEDICDADAHLRAVSGCTHTAWVGLGAGANLALAAVSRATTSPVSLVLWEPLETQADHDAEFRAASEPIRMPAPKHGHPTVFHADRPMRQIRGFPMPDAVADGFADLTLERQRPPSGVSCMVIASRPQAANTTWPRREIEHWRTTGDEFPISRTVSRKLVATVMDQFKDLS